MRLWRKGSIRHIVLPKKHLIPGLWTAIHESWDIRWVSWEKPKTGLFGDSLMTAYILDERYFLIFYNDSYFKKINYMLLPYKKKKELLL